MSHISDEDFAVIFNDTENYPSAMHVADALGISYQSVRNRASVIRQRKLVGKTEVELITRATKSLATTMKERLLEEFSEVKEESKTGKVSGHKFFDTTGRDPKEILPHYGNVDELRRQAGEVQTRDESRLARQVARHASLDHLRVVSEERKGYGESYIRDNPRRFKIVLGCNDLHDTEVDRFWLRVFIDTARRIQPDVICFNGDVFDLAEFGKYNVDPRDWDVVGRIKFVHEEIFKPLREACPNAQFDFMEGNHEHRLVRHLADASPAMMSILADLHKMTVASLLGLDKFEINYIAKGELTAFHSQDAKREIAKNYRIYYGALLANHFPDARSLAMPGWNGHHHSHEVRQLFNPMFGAYEWHQFGCGHSRQASYTQGEKWGMGFGIWHIDSHTKVTNCEYIPVTDMAIVGGQFYHRTPEETYSDPSILAAGK